MARTKTLPTLATTYAALCSAGACSNGRKTLARGLGGIGKYGRQTPITALQVLASNGVDDTIWMLGKAFSGDEEKRAERILRLFACRCAERALDRLGNGYGHDKRKLRSCIAVARKYANGQASDAAMLAAEAKADRTNLGGHWLDRSHADDLTLAAVCMAMNTSIDWYDASEAAGQASEALPENQRDAERAEQVRILERLLQFA